MKTTNLTQPIKPTSTALQWGSNKDSESQVIANAYHARAGRETLCPYQMNTANFQLWMHCRFGKRSDQETLKQNHDEH